MITPDRYSPIYTPESVRCVHSIRYDWNAWLSSGSFPSETPAAIDRCRPGWQADGLEAETYRVEGDMIQCLFAAAPTVSPAFCALRAKGRLQHALRELGTPLGFRRNISVRTLGDNTRETVAGYISRQVANSDYADPRFKEFLGRFTFDDAAERQDLPAATGHGRYWYGLHVVCVVGDRRLPMSRRETFCKVHDACPKIAAKKGYRLARMAVMPDHIHLALRGNIEHSPMETGLAFLNSLAFVLGNNRVWSEEFYVGTFSEYDVKAIGGQPRKPRMTCE